MLFFLRLNQEVKPRISRSRSTVNSIHAMEPQEVTQSSLLRDDEIKESDGEYRDRTDALIISVILQTKMDRHLPALPAALPYPPPPTHSEL